MRESSAIPPAHVRELAFGLRLRFPAARSIVHPEQVPDFLETESQPLGALMKRSRRGLQGRSDGYAERLVRLRQEPLALVEADGLDIDPGALASRPT